ncbi:LacI family DNA-binding transcriptional regulator [Microbacterium terrisoli]|uniref:LacI family DNA-binding transcriptional regulator n=1 Tax=Microbacterium terrisoli TaxID=3242192 RepID=UPI0028053D47|nr:LacI family DNA-binding transcriptional regulator [Microbacterium protaetiae]
MTVSVKDVAARAGVSVGTVSNVLNRPQHVSAATAERVRAAIDELGFVRNDAARQLRAGRSSAVGLIVLDMTNPFFADLTRGAEDVAQAAELAVIVGDGGERPDRERAYLDLFEQQRLRGVLLTPFGDVDERLRALRRRGIPTVLVDRASSDHSFSSVSVDDRLGGALAVGHLLNRGHRHIAYVAGPRGIAQVEDRLLGARDAAAEHPDARLEVVELTALSIAEGQRASAVLAAGGVDGRPDAVFAANDLIAIGLLGGLTAAGIRVPEDVALIGYDDIAFAAAATVPLSSIRQPAAQIGATGMRILLDESVDHTLPPRHVTFRPELVVRRSTEG